MKKMYKELYRKLQWDNFYAIVMNISVIIWAVITVGIVLLLQFNVKSFVEYLLVNIVGLCFGLLNWFYAGYAVKGIKANLREWK